MVLIDPADTPEQTHTPTATTIYTWLHMQRRHGFVLLELTRIYLFILDYEHFNKLITANDVDLSIPDSCECQPGDQCKTNISF